MEMDTASIILGLYDTKCLKFGQYVLKSGQKSPFYMNLRRLTLYPKLFNAVVSRAVSKFLTPAALHKHLVNGTGDTLESVIGKHVIEEGDSLVASDFDSQLDQGNNEMSTINYNNSSSSNNDDLVICAVPYGAIPLATAMAIKAGMPFLMERKEAKSYGDKQSLTDDFNERTRAAGRKDEPDAKIEGCLSEGDLVSKKQPRVILVEDVLCSGESVIDTIRALEFRGIKVEFVICIVDREQNGVQLLRRETGINIVTLFSISTIMGFLNLKGRISNHQCTAILDWSIANQYREFGINPNSDQMAPTVSEPTRASEQPARVTIESEQERPKLFEVVA